jgi:hypothetical protein
MTESDGPHGYSIWDLLESLGESRWEVIMSTVSDTRHTRLHVLSIVSTKRWQLFCGPMWTLDAFAFQVMKKL